MKGAVAKLKVCQLALKTKFEMLQTLDTEILEAIPDEDLEEEINNADKRIQAIQLGLIEIEDGLLRLSKDTTTPVTLEETTLTPDEP